MGDTKLMIQGFYKMHCKLGAAIRDDLGWDPVRAKDLLIVDVCHAFCIDVRHGRNDIYLFTTVVNIDSNGIVARDLW